MGRRELDRFQRRSGNRRASPRRPRRTPETLKTAPTQNSEAERPAICGVRSGYARARGAREEAGVKATIVAHWPRVLILHLLRWDTNRRLVPHGVVPDRALRVDGVRYALRAVVTHEGNATGSGHYVAFSARGDRWHVCNDSLVRPATETEAATCVRDDCEGHTYLLFYEKVHSPTATLVVD